MRNLFLSVCVSNDGNRIISGSEDKTVKVWNVENELCLNSLEGHSNWVKSVCFSGDGNIIVSGSEDKSIIVWDTVINE